MHGCNDIFSKFNSKSRSQTIHYTLSLEGNRQCRWRPKITDDSKIVHTDNDKAASLSDTVHNVMVYH